jgi:hypothetical protein
MKKIILLALFVLSINSCNKDDDDGCTCNARYLTSDGGQFFVPKQPIDCDTRQPTQTAPSGFFAGCTD